MAVVIPTNENSPMTSVSRDQGAMTKKGGKLLLRTTYRLSCMSNTDESLATSVFMHARIYNNMCT